MLFLWRGQWNTKEMVIWYCTCKYMYTHFIAVGNDPIWLTGTDTERDTPPEGGVAKKE